VDAQHTDINPSDYSFAPANMLSTNASGMFPFCQTGPADLAGGPSWDATAEGPQNFPEFPDSGDFYHGDAEDYVLSFDRVTPKPDHTDAMEEIPGRWTAAAPAESKPPKAEPMRRVTSKSSSSSHKQKGPKSTSSSKKARSRMQSVLAQQAGSQVTKLDMTGNASAYQDATLASSGRVVDVQPYLAQDLDTLTVSPHVSAAAFYPGMVAFHTDGLPYTDDLATTVVNPQVFDARLAGNSTPDSWSPLSPVDSCMSSPEDADFISGDVWPVVAPSSSSSSSSDGSNSPPMNDDHTPRYVVFANPQFFILHSNISDNTRMDASQFVSSEDLHGAVMGEDVYTLPLAFNSRRLSGEGESARDHYLYKNAFPHADGLFHCPWEGQTACNHKPEKLKCNYE
jgi:hypothetical protein